MRKHMFVGVKEGLSIRRLPAKMLKKMAVGGAVLALLPLQLLGPAFEVKTVEAHTWQTELKLADTSPELLVATSDVPVIEKTASRYQEEQTRLAHEREKRAKEQARIAQQGKSVTVSAGDVAMEQKIALAQKAAAQYGIPANLLVAVWKIESGMRWYYCGGSSVGARGPAQFMPGTWRGYAVDGNGDGVKDICHAEDAIPAAARYLAANGANRGDIQHALLRYNNAQWYVDKVLAMM